MEHPHAADRAVADPGAEPTARHADRPDPTPDVAADVDTDLDSDLDSVAERVSRSDVRTFGGDAVSAPALLATLAWQSVPSRPSGA